LGAKQKVVGDYLNGGWGWWRRSSGSRPANAAIGLNKRRRWGYAAGTKAKLVIAKLDRSWRVLPSMRGK
jgi:hypothetical protein